MKALVLAAGIGQRLGKITKKIPKPMIQINGKPILEHNILLLKKSGIKDIYINLHHLSHEVEDFFQSGKKWDVSITYLYEKELLGTSGTLKENKGLFPDKCLVMYGDNLFHKDTNITSLIDFHNKKKSDLTMALCEVEDISLSGSVKINSDNKIIKFIEKPKDLENKRGWVNAGIYIIESKVFKKIPDGKSDFSNDLIPKLLNSRYNLHAFNLNKIVLPIDTPERLNQALEKQQ